MYGFVLAEDSRITAEPGNGLAARSFPNKSKLLEVIPGDRYVTGISVLNRELLVVGSGVSSPQVNVYNTNNFTWIRDITICGSSSNAFQRINFR